MVENQIFNAHFKMTILSMLAFSALQAITEIVFQMESIVKKKTFRPIAITKGGFPNALLMHHLS